MGGDFRQVLPVIEKGSRGQMISACIVRSQLWATTKILHLRQNMLSIHDHEFAQFLMRIGDGNEPAKEDDMVKMPAEIFPRDEHILLSFDEVEGDTHDLYQQEYLHTIALGTLPPHILKIKIGNFLDVEILTGHNAGKRAFLPRIKLKTTDGVGLPFVLIRKQFPAKLSFEITINESQGQTIPNVRIYLPQHVFSNGQLYVALLRGVSRAATRVIIKDGKVEGEEGDFTKNIVFKEILLSQPHDVRVEQEKVGIFVPQGRYDILVESIGTKEHVGRIRGLGRGVSLKLHFNHRNELTNCFKYAEIGINGCAQPPNSKSVGHT
ncbi:uncharacterized protein LOC127104700 [Lathyrus oleraceus]|uniref:uncharacterized protein LOC127104700 n=1 Tax=Pisum sativum TaxID=3888 RepID=UPI0021D39218|nr:uncharacterized protein LOC127104700 [Pisum sativum]